MAAARARAAVAIAFAALRRGACAACAAVALRSRDASATRAHRTKRQRMARADACAAHALLRRVWRALATHVEAMRDVRVANERALVLWFVTTARKHLRAWRAAAGASARLRALRLASAVRHWQRWAVQRKVRVCIAPGCGSDGSGARAVRCAAGDCGVCAALHTTAAQSVPRAGDSCSGATAAGAVRVARAGPLLEAPRVAPVVAALPTGEGEVRARAALL